MPRAISTRRELLQLANTVDLLKHTLAHRYISEKLDGMRVLWDGGITRGLRTEDVPWAGLLHPKTGLRKAKIKPVATGLWSRYGNPVMAPDWFLNGLPACPLDGELWAGRGTWSSCLSAVRKDKAQDSQWKHVQYAVYSTPPLCQLFATGEIKNEQMLCNIDRESVERFVLKHIERFGGDYKSVDPGATFGQELSFLSAYVPTESDFLYVHRQVKLPGNEEAARAAALSFVEGVLEKGGEGAIVRDGASTWTPKRHNGLLKYKPFEDAEAIIIGFTAGEEGRIGQNLGRIGALIVRYTNDENVSAEFNLGGGLKPNEGERDFQSEKDSAFATANPGVVMPAGTQGKHFKVGQRVTFKYRTLSDDGVPIEARYFRIREDE